MSSSQARPRPVASKRRSSNPAEAAAASSSSARAAPPVSIAIASKKCSWRSVSPDTPRTPAASRAACACTRSAMARSPSGPCQATYMLAITASSTCAVQMLEVAFSRRMCCSRVCKVKRYAGLPSASTETPTSRPGSERLNASRVAMKAACGPPFPIGTPKRWLLPITTSAPCAPALSINTAASGSVATTTSSFAACAASTSARIERAAPLLPGLEMSSANGRSPSAGAAARASSSVTGAISRAIPSGSVRVLSTSMVCGCVSTSIRSRFPSATLPTACASVTASAAAVPSSRSDALAISIPVRSQIAVWKLISASSRPCAISG